MSSAPDIRRDALRGLSWTGVSAFLQRAGQFGFTVVLARLIAPHAWGLFAIMTVFTGFLSLFVDFGFASAIIQREDIEERHLNSAFWLNIAMGTVLMLVTIAMAPVLAAFYSQPRLLPLTIIFAPAFLLGSLVGIQAAVLRRKMAFRKFSVIDNLTFFGSNLIAVAMALSGLGVWSFVGLTIGSASIRSVLLWTTSDWRPTGPPDRQSVRELWGFSSNLTAFNALAYLEGNTDNLLIGRFIGVTPLGYYSRAYSLMSIPVDLVNLVTTRVMYPVMSRLQDDRERIKRIYLTALGMISLVTFPAVVGLFVLSAPFILTVYGPRWSPSIPLVRILCVASVIQTLTVTTQWIFSSQGRVDWLFRWGLVSATTVMIAFVIGLPWGVRGISVAYSVWCIVMMVPLFIVAGRLIDLRFREVARACLGVSVAAAVMGLLVWLTQRALPASLGHGIHLLVGITSGFVFYLIAIHLLAPAPYREVRRLLGDALRGRRASRALA